MHKVAIGIPTYNDFERVSNLLTSIFLYTPKQYCDRIVVLDDGSFALPSIILQLVSTML